MLSPVEPRVHVWASQPFPVDPRRAMAGRTCCQESLEGSEVVLGFTLLFSMGGWGVLPACPLGGLGKDSQRLSLSLWQMIGCIPNVGVSGYMLHVCKPKSQLGEPSPPAESAGGLQPPLRACERRDSYSLELTSAAWRQPVAFCSICDYEHLLAYCTRLLWVAWEGWVPP